MKIEEVGLPMPGFLILALLLVFTSVILADKLRGKVVSITDADTITVLDAKKKQHKIRLIEIDAPEKNMSSVPKAKIGWVSLWLTVNIPTHVTVNRTSLKEDVEKPNLPHAFGSEPVQATVKVVA